MYLLKRRVRCPHKNPAPTPARIMKPRPPGWSENPAPRCAVVLSACRRGSEAGFPGETSELCLFAHCLGSLPPSVMAWGAGVCWTGAVDVVVCHCQKCTSSRRSRALGASTAVRVGCGQKRGPQPVAPTHPLKVQTPLAAGVSVHCGTIRTQCIVPFYFPSHGMYCWPSHA